jgi:hypothetical protein
MIPFQLAAIWLLKPRPRRRSHNGATWGFGEGYVMVTEPDAAVFADVDRFEPMACTL